MNLEKPWSIQGETIAHTCSECGRKNRIPPEHLADKGRCGSCGSELPPLDQPLDVHPRLFDQVISRSKVPVLVDFWASWCGPCRMAAPEVHQTAVDMAGRSIVLKVDTEQHPELAERYGVRGIPNFLVCAGGGPVFQQAGAVDSSRMKGWLARAATHSGGHRKAG